MLMTPHQVHMRVLSLFRAGKLPMSTVGLPTIHGATVTGMQGIGVKTPDAAAVAAATVGLAMDEHMPKGRIFTKGRLSMMVAAGAMAKTRFVGRTESVDGAMPKLHVRMAPAVTKSPMLPPFCEGR